MLCIFVTLSTVLRSKAITQGKCAYLVFRNFHSVRDRKHMSSHECSVLYDRDSQIVAGIYKLPSLKALIAGLSLRGN